MKKSKILIFSIICLLAFAPLFSAVESKAYSGVIKFSTTTPVVQKGKVFSVVCQVTSAAPFSDVAFLIDYDSDLMEFVEGGKKITGGDGTISVSSIGNTTSVYKKTFSIQFKALKTGDSVIQVQGTADVNDMDGNLFSVSNNSLSVSVVPAKATSTVTNKPSQVATATPEPKKDSNNLIKSLDSTAVEMNPVFSSNQTEYIATVSNKDTTIFFTFETESEKSAVRIEGNTDLKVGDNDVRLTCISESNKKKVYTIKVKRETAEETAKRTNVVENEKEDVTFSVLKNGNKTIIKNAYDFEVIDPSNLTSVPEGYVQTNVNIDGNMIPAFTAKNDLDSNYLLLYLKGPSNETNMYQFDRTEKTLQKYTGNMVDKINKSAGQEEQKSEGSSFALVIVIVILVILLLGMMIAMLKIMIKQKEVISERRNDEDTIY